MGYNHLTTVKLAVAAALEPLMPTDPDTGQAIPLDYAWPGPELKRSTHAWLANGRTVSTPGSLSAGRKRRDQQVSFDVIIECVLVGETVDTEGRNILQQVADARVEEVAGIVDQYVADNPLLGQSQAGDVPIDYATFDSFTLSSGPLADGVGSTGVCQITYRIRPK